MIFGAGFHSYVVIHSVYFNVKRGEGETLEYKIWILIFYMKLPCFSSNGCFSSTLNFIENLIVYRKIDKESIFIRRAILRFIFSEENDEEKNFIWYFRTTLLFSKFLPVRSKLVLAIYFYVPFISWEPQVVQAPTIN